MELERRCLAFDECPEAELTIETRANGTQVLTGYAAVYNRFSLPLREGGSQFREIILPGAFDKVLNRQRGKQDVVALLNHNPDLILGRSASGTLELTSDDRGLRYTVIPPDTQVGRDTMELVRRRDLKGSSFAFGLEPGKGDRWSSDEQGAVREVREVSSLVDVSVVLTPAYPASSVTVAQRSYEAWLATQVPAATEERAEDRKALVDWIAKSRGISAAAAAWALRLRNV
jgi:HK97 family phage prohead protease